MFISDSFLFFVNTFSFSFCNFDFQKVINIYKIILCITAFVASLNSSYTRWYSKAVVQAKSEEIVNGLTASFETALKLYQKRNGNLPENVIIYR